MVRSIIKHMLTVVAALQTIAYMRNRRTMEHTAVELDSEEFYELRGVVGPDGRPDWEQTNYVDAKEQQARIAAGQPRDEDIGDDDQPVAHIMDTGPSVDVDQHLGEPTPGEKAMIEQFGEPEGASDSNPVARTRHPVDAEREGTGDTARLSSDDEDEDNGDEGLSKEQLQDELRERGLPVSGNKQELQQRLDEAEREEANA
jgi:hypothetical protein